MCLCNCIICVFAYLSCLPSRIGPVHFQARNLYLGSLGLFCVIVQLHLYVSLGFLFVFVTASSGFHFVFSVLAKRLAGKSVSEMTYLC